MSMSSTMTIFEVPANKDFHFLYGSSKNTGKSTIKIISDMEIGAADIVQKILNNFRNVWILEDYLLWFSK